jgi:Na+/melibiose symporter-like transporter
LEHGHEQVDTPQGSNYVKKLTHWYEFLSLNAYSLGISFMWNAIHPIFLPLLVLRLVPETLINAGLGLLSSVGLFIALLVQPLSGALSDATHSRWGRRRPWLLIGTIGDLIFLVVLAMAGSYWLLAIGYIGLQLSSNLAHGANQGLIPDLVPVQRRGEAAGLKNALDITAVVLAAAIIGRLLGGAKPRNTWSLVVIALVLAITLLITWRGAREDPQVERPNDNNQKKGRYLAALKVFFAIDLRSNRDYVKLMASRFLLLFGIYAVQSFALFYFRDALHMANAARFMSRVMTTIGLGLLLIAYPSGLLSERIGRKPMSIVACALSAIGIALFIIVRGTVGVYVAAAILGLGMGTFLTVNWSWATFMVPPAEAGKYLGLSNLATAGSGAIARLLGPAVDWGNRLSHNAGYMGLFVVATLAALGALALTIRLPEPTAPNVESGPLKGVFVPC